MIEPEKHVQIILNIGSDGNLSQAESDALLARLEAKVTEQVAGSVDIISKKAPEDRASKSEPIMMLVVAVLQHVIPKLIEVVYDMIKENRKNQVKAFAKVGGEQVVINSQTTPAEIHDIQNRIETTQTNEAAHERKYALLIGATSYQDSRLNQLASPEVDVQDLADLLRDPNVGGFDEVNLLLNHSSTEIARSVERFFKRKANTDLLVLYYSGHGLRGDHGKLYLAAENTDLELLNATAISSSFITEAMDSSQSERQVLILDCCYSGAFLKSGMGVTKAMSGAAVGVPVDATGAFEGNGYGRVILTATDKTQVALEGQRIIGQIQKSVFTEHLIAGLKSGEADRDRDGWIGLEELYKYVYNRMVKTTPDQTPEMNTLNMKGSIFLARNPRPKPMELPGELQTLIDHPYPSVRATAVSKLTELFDDSQYGMALAARKALEKLAEDDSRIVSEAAQKALGLNALDTPEPRSDVPPPPGPWWTTILPPPGTRTGGSGTRSSSLRS